MIEDQIEPRQSQEGLIQDKLQLNTLYGQARLKFIQKVFVILATQVIFTVIAVLLTIYNTTFTTFQQNYPFIFIVSLIGWVASYVMLVYGKMVRRYPHNIILLALYTFCQSYSISYLCATYLLPDFKGTIFAAAIMTLCIVIGCAIYAYKTKSDFTTNEGAKIIGMISCMMLLVFAFFDDVKFLNILLCALGAGLYGMHIIINIQVMIGSNQRQLSIDDFVICALVLYTDILQLFTCILMLFGGRRNT